MSNVEVGDRPDKNVEEVRRQLAAMGALHKQIQDGVPQERSPYEQRAAAVKEREEKLFERQQEQLDQVHDEFRAPIKKKPPAPRVLNPGGGE
jgi:hypothetical protein